MGTTSLILVSIAAVTIFTALMLSKKKIVLIRSQSN